MDVHVGKYCNRPQFCSPRCHWLRRLNARHIMKFYSGHVKGADMSVKEPSSSQWKERVRTSIRRSDGVIARTIPSPPAATGQLWETAYAVEEGKALLGI